MPESQKLYRFSLSIILGIFLALYSWNAWQYNTWWAYDGGAHIGYIRGLAEDGRLPDKNENYLAWHEPLYYFLNAGAVKGLERFGVPDRWVNKLLQLESAVWAWLFVGASGILAWQLSRKRWRTRFVMAFAGSLFITSALARYVTNEVMWQSLLLWWLVLFFYWGMFDMTNWNKQRWFALTAGLLLLVWIKLSGFILVSALVLWLFWLGFVKRSWRPVWVALIVSAVVGLGYSPWLIHKEKLYGTAFTINNFEIAKTSAMTKMPWSFYTGIDKSIFRSPFWPAGKGSFWSMFYASSLTDYDNVFGNYEQEKISAPWRLKTENGRLISLPYMARSIALVWWSLPLAGGLMIGGLLFLYLVIFKQKKPEHIFLGILVAGLVTALLYNTYQYPYLDRGIMKTILIVSFFPLGAILASEGWNYFWQKWNNKNRRLVFLAGGLYFVLWAIISLSVMVLPG